jgi:hypothetical protein
LFGPALEDKINDLVRDFQGRTPKGEEIQEVFWVLDTKPIDMMEVSMVRYASTR